MRKSKAYADVDLCNDREAEEKRRRQEEERREQVYNQERQRIEQERQRFEQEKTRADLAARAQEVTEEINRRANANLLATISKAILEGRCEDAKTVALTSSRLDLADQAMRLCQPAPKKPTLANPISRKTTPVSSPEVKTTPPLQANLLFEEPTGQGNTFCLYENQRRLTVAMGKKCPLKY